MYLFTGLSPWYRSATDDLNLLNMKEIVLDDGVGEFDDKLLEKFSFQYVCVKRMFYIYFSKTTSGFLFQPN